MARNATPASAVLRLRNSMKLSLSEMAARTGMDRMTIHRYEKGKLELSSFAAAKKLALFAIANDRPEICPDLLKTVSSKLGIPTDDLLASIRRAA